MCRMVYTWYKTNHRQEGGTQFVDSETVEARKRDIVGKDGEAAWRKHEYLHQMGEEPRQDATG